jgi:hypothetical protein
MAADRGAHCSKRLTHARCIVLDRSSPPRMKKACAIWRFRRLASLQTAMQSLHDMLRLAGRIARVEKRLILKAF